MIEFVISWIISSVNFLNLVRLLCSMPLTLGLIPTLGAKYVQFKKKKSIVVGSVIYHNRPTSFTKTIMPKEVNIMLFECLLLFLILFSCNTCWVPTWYHRNFYQKKKKPKGILLFIMCKALGGEAGFTRNWAHPQLHLVGPFFQL
jgi:hypothetical protein